MSDDAAQTDDNSRDLAAAAFEALRQEVERLSLAVTGLAAKHTEIEIPDYTETLGKMLQANQMTAGHLKTLAEMPALRLSPSRWSHEIAVAGEHARRQDHALLDSARQSFEGVAHDLASRLISARSVDTQRQWLIWTSLVSLFAGMLLCAVSLGPLLRAAPESWHWPEHMAARLLGMPEEEAGAHLIATAAPEHWRDIVLGYQTVAENRKDLVACKERAETTHRPVSCTILVRNPVSE